jgi:hypothetical protein
VARAQATIEDGYEDEGNKASPRVAEDRAREEGRDGQDCEEKSSAYCTTSKLGHSAVVSILLCALPPRQQGWIPAEARSNDAQLRMRRQNRRDQPVAAWRRPCAGRPAGWYL